MVGGRLAGLLVVSEVWDTGTQYSDLQLEMARPEVAQGGAEKSGELKLYRQDRTSLCTSGKPHIANFWGDRIPL